jgi:CRP-like cAMP-binding protein
MTVNPVIHKYLQMFAGADNTVALSEGEIIFQEGATGDVMYIVLEGEVDLQIAGKPVAHLDVGNTFGEMALIDDSPRSATAVAASDCKLARIDPGRYEQMIEETPYFAGHIVHILAERLRDMDRKFASL